MLCSIIHERCWENNVLKLSLDYFSCLCVFMSGIRNCCVYIKTPLRNRKYFIDNLLFVWKFVLWEDFFLDVLDANCLLFLNVNKIINSEKDDGWFFFFFFWQIVEILFWIKCIRRITLDKLIFIQLIIFQ